MNVSIFTCLAALLWFDLAIVVCAALRRHGSVLNRFGPWPLALVLAAGVLRLAFPVVFPTAKVIHSATVLPSIQDFLRLNVSWGVATVSVGTLLLFCWGVGTCAYLLKLAFSLWRDSAMIRRCACLPDQRVEAIVASVIGVGSQRYRIVLSPEAEAPVMAGFFTPVLVLPSYISSFSDAEVRYVIQHEWRHFRHHHIWLKLAAELFICFFWWNPPVYLLRRDVEQLLEIDSDLSVVKNLSSEGKAAYLEAIMKSALQNTGNTNALKLSPHLLRASCDRDIRQRFQMVGMDGQRQGRHKGFAWTGVLALLWLMSMLLVIQPYSLLGDAAMMDEGISGIGITSKNSYVVEEDGGYTLYTYGEPYQTFSGVCIELHLGGLEYIRLGMDSPSGENTLCISVTEKEDYIPIYSRNNAGGLILLELPMEYSEAYEASALSYAPPNVGTEENIRYYRTYDGQLQERLWSVTYRRWLTEWE